MKRKSALERRSRKQQVRKVQVQALVMREVLQNQRRGGEES